MKIVYLCIIIIMSVLSFCLFGADKWKAVHHRWRIPEGTLLLSAFFCGGIGAFLGMLVFHHKVRKWTFKLTVPLFALAQAAALAYLYRTALF